MNPPEDCNCNHPATMRDINAVYRLMAANERARDTALQKTELAASASTTNRLWLIGIVVTVVNVGLKFVFK